MPKPGLNYSHEEIRRLIEEDAIRRGYRGVSVTIENEPTSRNDLLRQATLSGSPVGPQVRAIVTAENINEEES